MLREEAEREAARRNLEDPERERFEFYAFDESVGLAPDAWDVGARLRDARAPIAPAPPPPEPPPPPVPKAKPEPVREPEPVPEPQPLPEPEPLRQPQPLPQRESLPERGRPGRFARVLGALTMVVGMLWMALIVVVAFLLEPDDLPALGLYLGAAALGLVAIAVGVAIRRS
jgi:hypothetical protein